jgi:hypothetical protein
MNADTPGSRLVRLATRKDLPRIQRIAEAAIDQLQRGFLDPAQIQSSRAIMGVDAQLIDDGTYFVVEIDGELAGCGGWSRRATLYGGDHSAGRSAALLDPATESARVRAMYIPTPRSSAAASEALSWRSANEPPPRKALRCWS